ncbi:hypothetical protein [Coleofasciculus sp.]|uniref:hypothetical protein n=1 Tax=Coleofasciculus sp. TaxID=3100458 RepID=UPI0039F924F5
MNTQTQSAPGLPCPECNFRIPMYIELLLSGSPIHCPACGLKLTVDREKSSESIAALEKLDLGLKQAQERIDEAKRNYS